MKRPWGGPALLPSNALFPILAHMIVRTAVLW